MIFECALQLVYPMVFRKPEARWLRLRQVMRQLRGSRKLMFSTDKIRALVADFEECLRAFWPNLLASDAAKVSEPVSDGPKRMSLSRQWTALEDHLHLEMARAQSVLQMQDTATIHLDAAHYALDRIAVELVDVMPSIMTVATVQPPRIYTPLDRTEPANVQIDHSIAA